MNKVKNVLGRAAQKVNSAKYELAGIMVSAMAGVPMNVHAAGLDGSGDVGSVVGSVADVVVNIFPFVGVFFVIAGVFKLIMAYRNDQPEAQASAAKDIVIGAVFLAFRIFAWTPIKGALGLS